MNTIIFVSTNFVVTNMKIEDIVKSSVIMGLSQKTVLNIIFTHNDITERLIEILKPYDLSNEQYNVLRILRGQKGNPANMCLIQERMLARTSNTTRLVDKLLLKELVTRKVCKENRRKIEVLITEKGLAILKELDPKVDDYEKNIVARLTTNELEQLNHILEKIRIK
jgi:DNA-binding MarR family transcriptional regulator